MASPFYIKLHTNQNAIELSVELKDRGYACRKFSLLSPYAMQQRRSMNLPDFERITIDPKVMGGKPCIRGIRITVGTITGLLASGETIERVLGLYPSLEKEDIYAALAYATWRAEEYDVPLKAS